MLNYQRVTYWNLWVPWWLRDWLFGNFGESWGSPILRSPFFVSRSSGTYATIVCGSSCSNFPFKLHEERSRPTTPAWTSWRWRIWAACWPDPWIWWWLHATACHPPLVFPKGHHCELNVRRVWTIWIWTFRIIWVPRLLQDWGWYWNKSKFLPGKKIKLLEKQFKVPLILCPLVPWSFGPLVPWPSGPIDPKTNSRQHAANNTKCCR